MAEIQIVYRGNWHCELNGKDYCMQCHTSCAEDLGCRMFNDGGKTEKDGRTIIPFGDCIYAKYDYKYKGWTGKRYEMEECRDPYNPHLDSMTVKLGNQMYDCVKVILDGKVIFNEFDEEEEKE